MNHNSSALGCTLPTPAGRGEVADFYLEKVRDLVFQRSRLHYDGHKKPVLRQRLDARLRQLTISDYASYWQHLLRDPNEVAFLCELLTVNETSFFRNPQQFGYLRDVVLPGWELARGQAALRSLGAHSSPARHGMKLRILCAGCATGEEPYSVAMTVLEALRYPRGWDIEIIAGDISASCLDTARAGYYEEGRLKGIPPRLVQRYLTPQPGGAVVGDELRRLVSFRHLNLGDLMNGQLPPGAQGDAAAFDLVFCRNVMIYFSPSCQQLLVDTLYRLVAPGGYLLTGDAEPLHLFDHDFVTVRDAACLIYQKTEKVPDARQSR